MTRTIKDVKEFTKTLNRLRPMAARLLLYFLLNKRRNKPFRMTLYEMGHLGHVKSAQRAIAEILEKGYLTREEDSTGHKYILNLDLVE